MQAHQDIYIHLFGHYFAIFIEFSFAYGSWEAFKDVVNKVSLKRQPFFEANTALITDLRAGVEVLTEDLGLPHEGDNGEDKTEERAHFRHKVEESQECLLYLEANELQAEGIYNGKKFQTLFYVIGILYLAAIILGSIQTPDLNKPIFVFLGTMSLIIIGHQWYYIGKIKKEARNFTPPAQPLAEENADVEEDSLFVTLLKFSIGIAIFQLVLVVLFAFVDCPHFLHLEFTLGNYTLVWKNVIKGGLLTFLILLPVQPYYYFFKRRKYFYQYYEKRFKEKSDRLIDLIKDINKIKKDGELIQRLKKGIIATNIPAPKKS